MAEYITSIHNPLIKQVRSLQLKKYRDKLGLFVVEGVRLTEEACKAGWEITALIYSEAVEENSRVQAVLKGRQNTRSRIVKVPPTVLAKISETTQPQGIMAVLRKRRFSWQDIVEQDKLLLCILDNLQDPGNVGTLIRTADAAGCKGVILSAGCADVFAGKTVRASMGSLFHLPVITDVELPEIYSRLKAAGVKITATSLATDKLYYEADLTGAMAIVFGNEGSGIGEVTKEAADELVKIPIYGQAESLNVAAAAAVLFYEAVRQRQVADKLVLG